MISNKLFYSGTSGLQTPIPKRDFSPEFATASRLTYYSSLFNSIEINSSFYKIPLEKTVAKWSAEVTNNFRFTFKLWQGITHNKRLAFNPNDVTQFMHAIESAGAKKGCLLIQFPPSLSITVKEQFKHLMAIVNTASSDDGWKIAVEFRDKSWYNDEIFDLLKVLQVGLVIQDLPASPTPLICTSPYFTYLRFHGPEGGYRGSYEDDFLYEYSQYIAAWQSEGKQVYAYFNNTMGNAIKNLITLNRFVKAVHDKD